MDFNIEHSLENERQLSNIHFKTQRKLKRIYTNIVHPLSIRKPLTLGKLFTGKSTYKEISKQVSEYIGRGPYINNEVLAPHIYEELLFFTTRTGDKMYFPPEVENMPRVSKFFTNQASFVPKIYEFSLNPLLESPPIVDPPTFPYCLKPQSNLLSFEDHNGFHIIHTTGNIVRDVTISDLGKYGENVYKNSVYKNPRNVPGDICQLQFTKTESEEKRLAIQQMYHCSILDISDKRNGKYKIKPIEVLQFSSKIADMSIYPYTGSVINVLDSGELTIWNGGDTVRLLFHPQYEPPRFSHPNYIDISSAGVQLKTVPTPILRRCIFTELESVLLVSEYDSIYLFDIREKSVKRTPSITHSGTPIYALKYNPYEPFQFAFTTSTSMKLYDQRNTKSPIHHWDVLLESEPLTNIEFLPRNDYCSENPFNGLISWNEYGSIIYFPYDTNYTILNDILRETDRFPLSVPAMNAFSKLSYISRIADKNLSVNSKKLGALKYSHDTKMHGINLLWYKQIHKSLKSSKDNSKEVDNNHNNNNHNNNNNGDDDDDDDNIGQNFVLSLQQSSMGDLYSEMLSYEQDSNLFDINICDFQQRDKVVVKRYEKLSESKRSILTTVNISDAIKTIITDFERDIGSSVKNDNIKKYANNHLSNNNDNNNNNVEQMFEVDYKEVERYLNEIWEMTLTYLLNRPVSLYFLWMELNKERNIQTLKDIPIVFVQQFFFSKSEPLKSLYYKSDQSRFFPNDPIYDLPANEFAPLYVFRLRHTKNTKLSSSRTTSQSLYDDELFDDDDDDDDGDEEDYGGDYDARKTDFYKPKHLNERAKEIQKRFSNTSKERVNALSTVFYSKESYHARFPNILYDPEPEKQSLKVKVGEEGLKDMVFTRHTLLGGSGSLSLDVEKLKRMWKRSKSDRKSTFSTPRSSFSFTAPRSQTHTPLANRSQSISSFPTPRTPLSSQKSTEHLSQDYDSFLSFFDESNSPPPVTEHSNDENLIDDDTVNDDGEKNDDDDDDDG